MLNSDRQKRDEELKKQMLGDNKKIKVELTIRKNLDVDRFLEVLGTWMVEKGYINPIIPMKERRK